MSEFSDSWIVRKTDDVDIPAVLKKAGVECSYANANDWMVVVAGARAKLPRLFEGTIIRYEYAEDHGMWLKIYSDGELIGEYACEYAEMDEDDTESGVNAPDFDYAAIAELLDCAELSLYAALHPRTFEDAFDVNHAFMELLGIPAVLYEWVSPDYLDSGDNEDFIAIE